MKVLVADDDAVSRVVVEGFLRRWDCEVVSVGDGIQAWSVLLSQDAPRLAILDRRLPSIDGLEIVKRIRDQNSLEYTYIILLTDREPEQDIMGWLKTGVDDYLSKPVSAGVLEARLHIGIRNLQLRQQLYSACERCQSQANHDALTGLKNQFAILEALKNEFARSMRNHSPLSIIIADVDHFNSVNENYGHQVGDALLTGIAPLILNALRAYDQVSHYGGGEFLIIVPDTQSQKAMEIAERIRKSVMTTQLHPDLQVTLSLGVANNGVIPVASADELLKAAESALYRAKTHGRNSVFGSE